MKDGNGGRWSAQDELRGLADAGIALSWIASLALLALMAAIAILLDRRRLWFRLCAARWPFLPNSVR